MAETKQKKGRRGSVVRFFIVGMTIAMLIFSIVVLIGVRLAVRDRKSTRLNSSHAT